MKRTLLVVLLCVGTVFAQEVRVTKHEVLRSASGTPKSVCMEFVVYNIPGQEPGQTWARKYCIEKAEFGALAGSWNSDGTPDKDKAAAIKIIMDREIGDTVFRAVESVKIETDAAAANIVATSVNLQKSAAPVIIDAAMAKAAHDKKMADDAATKAATTTMPPSTTTTTLKP